MHIEVSTIFVKALSALFFFELRSLSTTANLLGPQEDMCCEYQIK